jgi:hypothetical protein
MDCPANNRRTTLIKWFSLTTPFDLDKTPFEVLDKRITNLNRALDVCSKAFTETCSETVTRRDIENGLIEVLHLDEIFDLLHRDIDSREILALLAEVDFRYLRPVKLCEVSLDASILPDGLPLHLMEVEVKLKGEKWTVHKYDADPFPSNPHAHNYERSLKLHLGNGDIYLRRERKPCDQMERKNLVKLRDLVMQKNATITLPPLVI